MPTGTVKWFNNSKGYGFILPDEGSKDLFAHYSVIHMDGYKTLKAGQVVKFDTIEGPKGLHATNIQTPEQNHLSNRDAQANTDITADACSTHAYHNKCDEAIETIAE